MIPNPIAVHRRTCWLGISLAALSLLPPILAADSPLKIVDSRVLESEYGPVLTEVAVQPGEGFVSLFSVEGFQMTTDRTVWLDVALSLRNEKDEVVWDCASLDLSKNYNPFHAARIPMTVWFTCPGEAVAGKYTLKVTAVDKIGEGTASFDVALTITGPRLSVINPYFSADREGETESPSRFAQRQTAYLFVTVTGFERRPIEAPDPDPASPPDPPKEGEGELPVEPDVAMDLTLEFELLDADGKSIYLFPEPVVMNEPIAADARSVASHCFLSCTTSGRFAFRIKLRDGLSKATAVKVIPFEVVPP